jgi:site-specific DNA recombinase
MQTTKKNVGIWIRVSTDMQVKDDSPEHHEKRAKMYAEVKGWNVITVYRLDALSGKSIMDYHETKRMLKDIKDGTISGIIFSKLARLARNTKELLEISEIFRQNDADLISLAEAIDTSTPAGRLFFTIIAAMAQWEREEIADRVAASVPIRARMGKPLGGAASYGYKWKGKELVIDEKEAPIRKLLHETFLKTKRKKATAKELNDLGYRTRNGSSFSDTTIGRLLRDSTAKGIRLANYTKSLGEGKNWVIKPESEWIKIPCPPVITEELWNDCNAVLDQQEKKRSSVGPRTVYLLSGYVYCTCNAKMYVFTESPVYKCKKCKRKIAVADLDEIYHDQLKSFLLTDTDIETINSKSLTAIAEKETLLKTVSDEYAKLSKKVEEWLALRVSGEFSKDDFAKVYRPVEEQLRQIEKQIPILEAERDFLKIQYLSNDTIIQEAKDLYTRWPELPFEEKRNIIETITEKIVVDTNTIKISLSYIPTTHPSQNPGKRQHVSRDA